MNIREAINEKKSYIEERTENEVIIHEGPLLVSKAILDWGTWNKIGLPVIRHRHIDHEDDWVHVLHELIHIENFFVDGYWLVAHNNASLEDVDRLFKQIPEDYIAHKIIYSLGVNPVDREFVIENLLNTELNDRDIGAKFVLYHTYLEFNKDLEEDYNILRNQIQLSKPNVYELAQRAIAIARARAVHAQPVSQDFQITPSTINIKLNKNFWRNDISVVPSVTLNIHSLSRNDTVVDVFSDTFFEEKDRRPPFNSEAITFSIRQINQIEFLRVEIQVGFDLPSNLPPGLYNTKIYVTLSSGSTKSVPILLKVSASEWLMGVLIFFGVILNLLLFFIKDMVDGRNNLREKVNRTDELVTGAYDSVTKAFNESRLDKEN